MDALEAIRTRRSVRKFKSEAVSRELIEQVVDAGRLAATARNLQPWEFVVVTDPAKRRELANITENGKFIADAAVCIVVLSEPTKYFLEDGCAAAQNMLVAAHALGLGACWVAGDKKPYADQIVAMFNAPQGYKLIALIALGYAAEVPQPSKRPLKDVLHWEQF